MGSGNVLWSSSGSIHGTKESADLEQAELSQVAGKGSTIRDTPSSLGPTALTWTAGAPFLRHLTLRLTPRRELGCVPTELCVVITAQTRALFLCNAHSKTLTFNLATRRPLGTKTDEALEAQGG